MAAGFVDLMQSAGTLAIEQVVGGELAIWGTSRPRIDELIWTNPVQPVCEKWDDVWATPSCQSLADPAHRFRVERTLQRQW